MICFDVASSSTTVLAVLPQSNPFLLGNRIEHKFTRNLSSFFSIPPRSSLYLSRTIFTIRSKDVSASNSHVEDRKPRSKKPFSSRIIRSAEEAAAALRRDARRIAIAAAISAALGFCLLLLKLTAPPASKVVPYSELVARLHDGGVAAVLFEEGSRRIFFNSRDSGGEMKRSAVPKWQFSTRKIDGDENYLLSLAREKETSYSSAPLSVIMSLRSILITMISLWIPLTPLLWLLHRQLSSANSPAKRRWPSSQNISFDSVEGVDAAKEELMEIVSCLHGSIKYQKLGAKLPRGVLLVGPPGTGKTLLARAVAGEAGVPFFSVSASEFVELFVGRGAARIRDLFNVAKKCAPSIVFIDELDAVGGKRGKSFNDERDQTLNQLLTEMDGFESEAQVVVIAATNRPEALDPALCRPGRFSRKVLVGEPDFDGRKKILAIHLRGVPLDEEPDIICSLVASLTPSFVGADLANIVNEAALLAGRRGNDSVSREDIMAAVERAKFGINYGPPTRNSNNKALRKIFPWLRALVRKELLNDEGLYGYQSLS